jgi:hypothetical protein
MMIFSINKNYLSFVLIFNFSQLTEKVVATRGVINYLLRILIVVIIDFLNMFGYSSYSKYFYKKYIFWDNFFIIK